MDVKAPCSGQYVAVHDSGPREAADIGWVVIHSTEGDTAAGAAGWFSLAASSGSANLVVDDNECFRTVADLRIPWAAPPLNKRGFHIELAGHAAWTQEEWLKHPGTLHRAAYKAATRCKAYGVPVRQVGWLGLLLGRKGITSHNAISLAWHQSDHHDPGPSFPWAYFMDLVKTYGVELGL